VRASLSRSPSADSLERRTDRVHAVADDEIFGAEDLIDELDRGAMLLEPGLVEEMEAEAALDP